MPVIARTPELLHALDELDAFTAVLRTHEGLDSADLGAVRLERRNAAHHVALRQGLQRARRLSQSGRRGGARGYPVVRHPFLHYPDDPNTYELRYQFLLGPDLMVAPVVDKGADSVDVYFPPASLDGSVDGRRGRRAGRMGEAFGAARQAGGLSAQGAGRADDHRRIESGWRPLTGGDAMGRLSGRRGGRPPGWSSCGLSRARRARSDWSRRGGRRRRSRRRETTRRGPFRPRPCSPRRRGRTRRG